MSPATGWIGGASLAIGLAFAAMLTLGNASDATQGAPSASGWAGTGRDVDEGARPSTQSRRISGGLPEQRTQDSAAADPDSGEADGVAKAQPATTPFVIKRILPIDGPIRYGEWHWDDAGIPDGPLVMTVDLEARVISVFRDGYEIGAAAAMLGTDDHPTPLGTFPILSKERDNVSEKYGNAPMPWTLRLTWDGVAIHGGAEVEKGYASHGCIAVPNAFAARLFDAATKGDRVIITNGQSAGLGTPLAS